MMKHHESLSASTRSEESDAEKTVFRLVVASVLLYVLQSRNVASREERPRDRGRASHRNGARFLFRALFDVECLVSRSRRERAIERLGYQRRSTLAKTRGHGRARHLIRSRNAFATTSVVAPKRMETARLRACESTESLHRPTAARKTPTCLSRPPEARCGRARGCGKRRARFRRGGLRRLRPPDPLRLRPGLRRRRRRTLPRAFSAASRRTTPRTRGRSWTGSCFVTPRARRERRRGERDGCQRDETEPRRRRRGRDLGTGRGRARTTRR